MPSFLTLCYCALRFVSAAARHPYYKMCKTVRLAVNYVFKSSSWDALLVLIPGVMGLATGFRMKTDKYSPSYLEVVCHSVSSWPRFAPSVLLVTSIVAIFIGIFRFAVIGLGSKTTIIYYMCLLLVLAVVNCVAGSASAMAGKKIRIGLEGSLMDQLSNIYDEGSPLQLNSDLEESWDVIQMQFSCCGANGYRDYTELPAAKKKTVLIPQSCCTIQWKDEMPQINNFDQCQLDAKLGVRDSTYINMEGCLFHLTLWLRHYLYAQVFVMFAATVAQSLGLMYVYMIYYRDATSSSGIRR